MKPKRGKELSEVKQILVIRTDLNIGKGKIAAQASHASVLATLEAQKHNKVWYDRWFKLGMKKLDVDIIELDDIVTYCFEDIAKSITQY